MPSVAWKNRFREMGKETFCAVEKKREKGGKEKDDGNSLEKQKGGRHRDKKQFKGH